MNPYLIRLKLAQELDLMLRAQDTPPYECVNPKWSTDMKKILYGLPIVEDSPDCADVI